MKNKLSENIEQIPWNEFEVIARNTGHVVRIANRLLRKRIRKFQEQARLHHQVCILDTEQVLDYSYDDDMSRMEEFRVKRHNELFGFSEENPSDALYQDIHVN